MRNGPVQRPAGFTLVEVLVAMSIMAIVAIMSWQGVDGIVRARAASQDKLEQLLRVSTVLAQWEQDLSNLQDTGLTDEPLKFDGAKVTLTRRTPSGLQLVVWSLRNGTWMRWAGPSVTTTQALKENLRSSEQFLGNEAGQLRALPGVLQWQVYPNRGNDNAYSNAQSSTGSSTAGVQAPAPGASQAQPPQGQAGSSNVLRSVRLVLTFSGDKGYVGSVTRDIAIGQ